VAILGYAVWQSRYSGDPNILGRRVRLNEQEFTVVGVMPEGVKFPVNQELWIPLFAAGPASSMLKRELSCCIAYGRLADGVKLADAQAEMDIIAGRLQSEYAASNKGRGITVTPYTSFFSGPTVRVLFLAMLGAVGFVLLIACANVMNLLLSRSVTRTREVSIRAALGASRRRVVRQLLIESALLSMLGGAAGLLIAVWGVRAFRAALPPGIPYWLDFSIDYEVFGYLAAICCAASFLFGLAPALHMTKVDLSSTLREGARGSGSKHSRILSRGLVVTELALALVLLVAAGLMIRSFLNVQRMSANFEDDRVLTMWVFMSGATYLTPEPRISFLERLDLELQSISGATVAMASTLPLNGTFTWQFELEGRPVIDVKDRPSALGLEITPRYFDVLGLPIVQGRSFGSQDGRAGRSALIVNQLFAKKYWPGEDPIGKRIRMTREEGDLRSGNIDQPLLSVVGVVPDVKQNWDLNAALEPVMYVPYRQGQMARGMVIMARSMGGDAHSLTPTVRGAVQKVNSAMPVIDVLTLPEHFQRIHWFQRVFSILFAIFACIGLLLAVIGIYAVMAYSVSQRTRELGIRIALGGQRRSILALVVAHALRLSMIGVAIGLAGCYAVTRVMTSLLVGVPPTDMFTFTTVAVGLAGVAVFASYVPARRASRLDPVVALRAE
jgi:putative ABC transport system permease protein